MYCNTSFHYCQDFDTIFIFLFFLSLSCKTVRSPPYKKHKKEQDYALNATLPPSFVFLSVEIGQSHLPISSVNFIRQFHSQKLPVSHRNSRSRPRSFSHRRHGFGDTTATQRTLRKFPANIPARAELRNIHTLAQAIPPAWKFSKSPYCKC